LRRVLLLEEFKKHLAFCKVKSGAQARVIALGENSSQSDQSATYFFQYFTRTSSGTLTCVARTAHVAHVARVARVTRVARAWCE